MLFVLSKRMCIRCRTSSVLLIKVRYHNFCVSPKRPKKAIMATLRESLKSSSSIRFQSNSACYAMPGCELDTSASQNRCQPLETIFALFMTPKRCAVVLLVRKTDRLFQCSDRGIKVDLQLRSCYELPAILPASLTSSSAGELLKMLKIVYTMALVSQCLSFGAYRTQRLVIQFSIHQIDYQNTTQNRNSRQTSKSVIGRFEQAMLQAEDNSLASKPLDHFSS